VLTLHTLGECRIAVSPRCPGGAGRAADLAPAADRLFSLALRLAAEPGRRMPRAQVAAWLWPELPARPARRRLRQALYRLRALGIPVAGGADHLMLAPALVAPTFAAAPSVAALRTGWHDGSVRFGRCLPGWEPGGDALRAWADGYRARVEAAARSALAAALAAEPDPPADVRGPDVPGPDDGTPNALPVTAGSPNAGPSTAAGPNGTLPAPPAPPGDLLARALLELDPAHPAARRYLARRPPHGAVGEPRGDAAYGPRARPDVNAWARRARPRHARPADAGARGASPANAPANAPVDPSRDAALLGALDARLSAARAGAGGLILLAGPPDGSASRLLAAVARRGTGAHVVWVDCAPSASRAPTGPAPRPTAPSHVDLMGALARALLACPGALGAAPAAVAMLRRYVAAAGGSRGADRAHHVAACVAELGAAVAEEHPLVVCVDQAQHADAASWGVLATAARRWATAPAVAAVACATAAGRVTSHGSHRVARSALAGSPAVEAGGSSPNAGRTVAHRWGTWLAAVAAAVAAGRPLVVEVGTGDGEAEVRVGGAGGAPATRADGEARGRRTIG
jgi:hypothetical protein